MAFDTTAANNYLTVPELAVAWRVTEAHLYALIKRGALPAARVGRRVIVRRDAAEKFIERNTTASAAA
jgi:excisionase family DNA binding protein